MLNSGFSGLEDNKKASFCKESFQSRGKGFSLFIIPVKEVVNVVIVHYLFIKDVSSCIGRFHHSYAPGEILADTAL